MADARSTHQGSDPGTPGAGAVLKHLACGDPDLGRNHRPGNGEEAVALVEELQKDLDGPTLNLPGLVRDQGTLQEGTSTPGTPFRQAPNDSRFSAEICPNPIDPVVFNLKEPSHAFYPFSQILLPLRLLSFPRKRTQEIS